MGIDEAGDSARAADWTPTQIGPLAGQRQVDSEIGIRMHFRLTRYLVKPRPGNQDAGRSNPSVLESLERGLVDGMIHAEVVRVNHQQACRGRVAQAPVERLTFPGLGNADLDKAKADRKVQE